MEPNHPPAPRGSREPTRNYIQTNNLTVSDRTQRFSWQETPLDLRRPAVQQSSPTNSSIDESPLDGYNTLPSIPQMPPQSQYVVEKPPVAHTGSPYNVPEINQTHPAYFAPAVDQDKLPQPRPAQPSTMSVTASQKEEEKKKPPSTAFAPNVGSEHKDSPQPVKPESDRSTLVYKPHSLAGPNAAVENHRPGQVAHPNAAIDPEWKHGLCEVDTFYDIRSAAAMRTPSDGQRTLFGTGLLVLSVLLTTVKPMSSSSSSPSQAPTLAGYRERHPK
ncbi:hypothetical protein Q9189_005965 [Teloschistes chrysophthalmus]